MIHRLVGPWERGYVASGEGHGRTYWWGYGYRRQVRFFDAIRTSKSVCALQPYWAQTFTRLTEQKRAFPRTWRERTYQSSEIRRAQRNRDMYLVTKLDTPYDEITRRRHVAYETACSAAYSGVLERPIRSP